jgi:hypothetical protein
MATITSSLSIRRCLFFQRSDDPETNKLKTQGQRSPEKSVDHAPSFLKRIAQAREESKKKIRSERNLLGGSGPFLK